MSTVVALGPYQLKVEAAQTQDQYALWPRISENCICGDCAWFEEHVPRLGPCLFHTLALVGVDLTRQPNDPEDALCSLSTDQDAFPVYVGFYILVGQLLRSPLPPKRPAHPASMGWRAHEQTAEAQVHYSIVSESVDRLRVDFWVAWKRTSS